MNADKGRMCFLLTVRVIEPASRSNGPGWRTVLWTQGCTLNCSGCFNPETHSKMKGSLMPVSLVLQKVFLYPSRVEGITISGGEPLQQLPGLLAFLTEIRRTTDLSVLLFSGYDWAEINRMPKADSLLPLIDVIIAGRYIPNQRLARGLIGSSNKTVHFLTNRYSHADLTEVPEAEVILNQNGEIIFSGINPIY